MQSSLGGRRLGVFHKLRGGQHAWGGESWGKEVRGPGRLERQDHIRRGLSGLGYFFLGYGGQHLEWFRRGTGTDFKALCPTESSSELLCQSLDFTVFSPGKSQRKRLRSPHVLEVKEVRRLCPPAAGPVLA